MPPEIKRASELRKREELETLEEADAAGKKSGIVFTPGTQIDPNAPLPTGDTEAGKPEPPTTKPAEPPPAAAAGSDRITNPVAEFAGIDKITGRIITFDVYIDETVQFGALQITPRACYTRPATELQRTSVFLEVDQVSLKGGSQRVFTGWMFADSPALNAIDHSVYDIWLVDCRQATDVPPNLDFQHIADSLGVPVLGRHSALGDAVTVGLCWLALQAPRGPAPGDRGQ
jgi:hypothetical protein